jgi:hypothetical protein
MRFHSEGRDSHKWGFFPSGLDRELNAWDAWDAWDAGYLPVSTVVFGGSLWEDWALRGAHSVAVMQVAAVGALVGQRVSALAFYCYVFPSYQKTYSIGGQREIIPPF